MINLIWTMPLLLFAAIVIGWAAEITSVHISAGIALAVLAWLQTAPEFAVEAVIAWHRDSSLVLANLTGSLRLLMGLGWPMIFFIHWFYQRRRRRNVNTPILKYVRLPAFFSVECGGLFISLLYFLVIYFKGTWSAVDGIVLCGLYGVYFWLLNRQRKIGIEEPSHDEDDEGGIVAKIMLLSNRKQIIWGWTFFIGGGLILIFTAHPFIDALKSTALTLGVSQYVFIQWIAPLASEFPEKITAFNWARRPSKVPMAIVNMLSSIICQWTLFAGLVPIIFSISAGEWTSIHFTEFQKTELLITIAQSAVAFIFLADLKIYFYEAAGLFVLWLFQFIFPHSRVALTYVYGLWFLIEFFRICFDIKRAEAWRVFYHIVMLKPINSKRTN